MFLALVFDYDDHIFKQQDGALKQLRLKLSTTPSWQHLAFIAGALTYLYL